MLFAYPGVYEPCGLFTPDHFKLIIVTIIGIIIALKITIKVTNYITLNLNDIKYYASLVGIVCVLAFILNNIFDSNLMFISKNFEEIAIIDFLYNATGPFYTLVTSVCQMTLPFYTIYGITKSSKKGPGPFCIVWRK